VKSETIGGKVEPEISLKLANISRNLGRSKARVIAALIELVDEKTMAALRRKDWNK
jgi:predicted DNA-binding protein